MIRAMRREQLPNLGSSLTGLQTTWQDRGALPLATILPSFQAGEQEVYKAQGVAPGYLVMCLRRGIRTVVWSVVKEMANQMSC